jgi:hypothetical protein
MIDGGWDIPLPPAQNKMALRRILALDKVEGFKGLEQHWVRTVDPVEVRMLKGRLLVAPHSCHYNTIQYNDISLTNI